MAADVKEMCDWLLQHNVIKAIEWVLKTVEMRSRRAHVTIFYRSSKLNRLGKSYCPDELVSIPVQKSFEVSKFQIKHAFFVLMVSFFFSFSGYHKEDLAPLSSQ